VDGVKVVSNVGEPRKINQDRLRDVHIYLIIDLDLPLKIPDKETIVQFHHHSPIACIRRSLDSSTGPVLGGILGLARPRIHHLPLYSPEKTILAPRSLFLTTPTHLVPWKFILGPFRSPWPPPPPRRTPVPHGNFYHSQKW
jgi:hypothetical protein